MKPDKSKAFFFASRFAGLFIIFLLVFADLKLPAVMQRSDFETNFYVAGHMIADGHAAQLYPPPGTTSYLETDFNLRAHQLLKDLPEKTVAIYMYSPLVALILAPFSLLGPALSMLAWQIASVGALLACAAFFARLTAARLSDLFWGSFMFFPVFHILLIGHIAIILGLLPLSAGYFFLVRGKPFACGLIWSFLLLKLQFLPVALLFAGALCLVRQFRCLSGLACGMVLLALLTVTLLPPQVALNWLSSLKLSDTILANPIYGYPSYLLACMPGVVLHAIPEAQRVLVKMFVYGLAFLLGIHALWLSRARILESGSDIRSAAPTIWLTGLFILPLVVPHFLFYDLCVLLPGAMIIYAGKWEPEKALPLRQAGLSAWVLIDLYFVLFMSGQSQIAQPAVLVLILAGLYFSILAITGSQVKAPLTEE